MGQGIGQILVYVAILLALSLLSYSPLDSSFNVAASPASATETSATPPARTFECFIDPSVDPSRAWRP